MTIIDNKDGTYAVTFSATEAATIARYASEGGVPPLDAAKGWFEQHLAELQARYDAFDATQRRDLYVKATTQEQADLKAVYDAIKSREGSRP